MGQKINPISYRIGVNRIWDSRWFAAPSNYAKSLHEDLRIRTFLQKKLRSAGLSRVVIERSINKVHVNIYAVRRGMIIGKKGQDIDDLSNAINKMTESEVAINILEVRKPDTDAKVIADSIAMQLEKRVLFRKAMKRAMQTAMRLGAKGIRVNCSGRLGGVEIARTEWYREGRVPLNTLRSDIDYGASTAFTNYGACGVKVWIYKGNILESDLMARERKMKNENSY